MRRIFAFLLAWILLLGALPVGTISVNATDVAQSEETIPEETVSEETEPAPEMTEPEETEPVPEETKPIPEETEPIPEETESVPEETEPIPEETEPVPEETEPVPEETESIPEETEPIPQETAPVPEQITEEGDSLEDEAQKTLPSGIVYQMGADAVAITGYTGTSWKLEIPAAIEDKPVTAIGAFESLQAVEDAVAEGKCDYVAMCRQLIADPDTIHKAKEGNADDVVPCIKCMRCHDSDCYAHLFRCAVNPKVGYDACWEQMFPAAPKKLKKVAVIGGGPAGMKAAITACDRGHTVTLFEKADKLGGALEFSEFVEFKYALCSYKNYLVKQVGKRPIEVKLNTEATPAMLSGSFDAVIIAVGAEPLMLPLPGFNTDNGMVATDAYCNEDKLGKKIVVIGGGQVGCETALHLADKGYEVSIIEMQSSLCPDASKTCGDEIRILLDANKNFTAICSAKCKSVTKNSVTYTDAEGSEHTVECDTVILAAGMKARTALADSFITDCDVPEWYQIGDCVRARTVEEATAEAYNAAMTL